MEQLQRRVTYFLVGVAPAMWLLKVASLEAQLLRMDTLFGPLCIAGTSGLMVATVLRFPVLVRPVRLVVAGLLLAGLMLMGPWSAILLYSSFVDLVQSLVKAGGWVHPLQVFLKFLWWFGGPVAVAVHFLAFAGRASDYSSKPTLLNID